MSLKYHQGRTLTEEYRRLKASEGDDRSIIQHLLFERMFSVKTMINLRNDFYNVLAAGNTDRLRLNSVQMQLLDSIDKKIKEWKHVTEIKDNL